MADVFGYDREAKPAGLFTSEGSIVELSGLGKIALGQNVTMTYAQRVDDIYEIGSSNLYWVGGRPSGTGTIGRLVGPSGSIKAALAQMSICNNGGTMSLKMAGQPCPVGSLGATATGVIATQISYTLNSGTISITESIELKFARLEL